MTNAAWWIWGLSLAGAFSSLLISIFINNRHAKREKKLMANWWGITDNRSTPFPELAHQEGMARLVLAKSIIAVDMAIAEGRVGVWEQAEAELALQAYGRALAALLHGDDTEPSNVEVTAVDYGGQEITTTDTVTFPAREDGSENE